jgi:hypothetical protein
MHVYSPLYDTFCYYYHSFPNPNGLIVRKKLSNGIRLVVCQCRLEERDSEPCLLIGVLQSGNLNEQTNIIIIITVVVIILGVVEWCR